MKTETLSRLNLTGYIPGVSVRFDVYNDFDA